ncbi:MAG: hypothetical protein CMJ83_00805, partial [Planctomycetes bacterium]|nr:hypothetical protein [Planctomycetota bacterium]
MSRRSHLTLLIMTALAAGVAFVVWGPISGHPRGDVAPTEDVSVRLEVVDANGQPLAGVRV